MYLGNSNVFEFKRTLSRLKEMGSNSYINKYLKKLIKSN
jgi:predicted ATPase